MADRYYNGYSWKQRLKNTPELKIALPNGYRSGPGPCDLCGDPKPPTEQHSEDYSEPYTFKPPQSYWLCKSCHSRLHKRFKQPKERWALFLIHLRVGGYGAEFSKLYSVSQRKVWQSELATGKNVALDRIRERKLVGDPWWEKLTLDPESLVAAWARPRPLRPRPDLEAYRAAMAQVQPSDKELALLRCHATSPNRSASMRYLAKHALNSDNPSTANLAYGSLAHRLCSALPEWIPDTRKDGSPIWMSVIGEGWEPEQREFEWVLVPQLRELFGESLPRFANASALP